MADFMAKIPGKVADIPLLLDAAESTLGTSSDTQEARMTSASHSSDRLLSRREVEQHFGFPTQRYLEIAATRGDGPPMIRIGRTVRYKLVDVRAWIDARRVRSTSDRG